MKVEEIQFHLRLFTAENVITFKNLFLYGDNVI